jgi:hypothetical protein
MLSGLRFLRESAHRESPFVGFKYNSIFTGRQRQAQQLDLASSE